jgi:xyloglucan-specific endo-beta-1,4-glucanase
MTWLSALGGASPISSTASPIATPTIDSVSWKLFSGMNYSTKVYSFVASSQVTSFSGNLLDFFSKYLRASMDSLSQYLLSIGAGAELFTGML